MIASWVDIFVNLIAAIGLLVMSYSLMTQGSSPIEKHTAHVAIAAAMLVSLRAFFSMTGFSILEALSLLAAITIPLLILIATEQLMRRHSHGFVKILVAGWVGLGGLLIIFGRPEPVFTYANAAMQSLIPLFCVFWILLRNKSQFTQAENRNMRVFIAALVFVVSFCLTDFPSLVPSPVRLGAVSMLIVAYLLVFANQREFSVRRAGIELTAILASLTCFFGMTRLILGQGSLTDSLRLAVLLFCTLLLTVILVRVVLRKFEFQEFSNNTIANARTDSVENFLEDTLIARVSTEAHILGPEHLADYDMELIIQAFKTYPVISQKIRESADQNDMALDQIFDVMGRYKSTHSLLIPGTPPKLLVSSVPTLSNAHEQDTYFGIIAKMTRMINPAQNS